MTTIPTNNNTNPNPSSTSTRPSSLRARLTQAWNPLTLFRTGAPSAPPVVADPLQNLLLMMRIGDQAGAIKLLQESPKLCSAADASTGLTPLHIAATGYLVIMEMLLQGGASPLVKDHQGWNALHMACNSSSPDYLEIVETLIRATPESSRVALISACNQTNTTPLGLLCRNTCYTQLGAPGFIRFSDTLKGFLALGADVNHQTDLGISPLHEATARKNLTGINLLVEHGALVNLVNLAGESPLHWAVQSGDPTIARALINHGADPFLATSAKGTPAAMGLDSGNQGMVNVFLSLTPPVQNNPLFSSSSSTSSTSSSSSSSLNSTAIISSSINTSPSDPPSPPTDSSPSTPLKKNNDGSSLSFPTVLNLEDDPVLLETLRGLLVKTGKVHYLSFYNDVNNLRRLNSASIIDSFPMLVANYFSEPARVALIFRLAADDRELCTASELWATLDILQHNVVQHLNRMLKDIAILENPTLAQLSSSFSAASPLDLVTTETMGSDDSNGDDELTEEAFDPQEGASSHQHAAPERAGLPIGRPAATTSATSGPSEGAQASSLSISFSRSSLAEPPSTRSEDDTPPVAVPISAPTSTCPPTCLCSNAPIGPHSFEIVKFLGRGSCGEVYLVRRTSCRTRQELLFAMKVLTKQQILQQNKVGRVLMEQEILMLANNPFIVKLFYSFQTEHFLHFVIELCIGGTLFRLVKGQPNSRISEEFVRFYAAEVLLALEHLHSIGYVHRDIKPENILISENGHLKLADFDLSANIEATTHHPSASRRPRLSSFVGTPDYLSPEVVQGGTQGYVLDFWSLGVLIFEMLFGSSPFITSPTSRSSNVSFRYVIPPEPRISAQARSLIHALLQPAEKRIGRRNGVQEIKAHPWFEGIDWSSIDQIQAPFDPRSYLTSPTDTRYFRNLHQRQLSKTYYSSPLLTDILPATDPFYPFLLLSSPILAAELPIEPHFITPDAPATPIRDATMSGWMYKQGYFRKNWRFRWFVLSQERGVWYLKYFINQTALKLLDQVDLSHAEEISVGDLQRFPISLPADAKVEALFHLILPNRIYHFIAPSAQEREEWRTNLSKIITSRSVPSN